MSPMEAGTARDGVHAQVAPATGHGGVGRVEYLEEKSNSGNVHAARGVTGEASGRKRWAWKKYDTPMTPPINSSLFAPALGKGTRMHMDSLDGPPRTPVTTSRRPVEPPRYFIYEQAGYGGPRQGNEFHIAQGQAVHGMPPEIGARGNMQG
ncbi:unnamed protein product [Peronospora effusa]|nr:unnamed protein product [Peronospora effusa]